MIYPDTSGLVAFYVTEQASHGVRRQVAAPERLLVTPLHHAEWPSAILFRRRQSLLSAADEARLFEQFREDLAIAIWQQTDFPVGAWLRAQALTRRHGPQLPIRALDTLHVAAALELGAERFWTLDRRQAALAAAAGLDLI